MEDELFLKFWIFFFSFLKSRYTYHVIAQMALSKSGLICILSTPKKMAVKQNVHMEH